MTISQLITYVKKCNTRSGLLIAASVLVLAALAAGGLAAHAGNRATTTTPAASTIAKPAVNGAPAPLTSVSTSESSAQALASQTVTVDVTAHSADAVNALQVKLHYPADKLAFQSISEGTAFPVALATDTATPGLIRLARGAAMGSTGASGDNEVVAITFTKKTTDTTPVTISLDAAGSGLARSSDHANILASGKGNLTLTISP